MNNKIMSSYDVIFKLPKSESGKLVRIGIPSAIIRYQVIFLFSFRKISDFMVFKMPQNSIFCRSHKTVILFACKLNFFVLFRRNVSLGKFLHRPGDFPWG